MQIFVDGRGYKTHINLVSFGDVVDIWNELNKSEGRRIEGNPGIDYTDDIWGCDGVLLVNESVKIKDGTSFNVTPEHVA